MTELARIELLAAASHVLLALATAGHAVMNKRDPRSAWAWITVCWLFPIGGAIF